MGIFKKLSNALKKTKEAFQKKLDYIFSNGQLDDDFYEELTDILISADLGFETSEEVVNELRLYVRKNKIRTMDEVKLALKIVLKQIIDLPTPVKIETPAIISIVGVNGVGKTTTIGKLAAYFKNNKKEVVLAAADTFRAAATEQLTIWGERNSVRVIKHAEGADPAAVVFDAVQSVKSKNTDILIIDTAGRLHTKVNLMQELEKINKVILKEHPNAKHYTFLVLDATVGQNAISQLQTFNEYVKIDGIVLTKLDGTAKGGVVIAIAKQTSLPVVFVGTGETIDDLEEFSSQEFVDNLF